MVFAGFRDHFHQVGLSVHQRAFGDVVVGKGTGPQAKSIVVLHREDDAIEAGQPNHLGPLIHIQTGWIEQLRAFVAEAPLLVGEGVDGEVDKGILLHLMPSQLGLGWQGQEGAGAGVWACMYCESGSAQIIKIRRQSMVEQYERKLLASSMGHNILKTMFNF